MSRATIKDISEKIGVSTTSVSLVLNNKKNRISQKTKDLILETAKELNYHPNALAASLVTNRTNTIGLIICDIGNDFFSTLAKGVQDECLKHNKTLILCHTNDDYDQELQALDTLIHRRVDGILYCATMNTTSKLFIESIRKMENANIPYVTIDRTYESLKISSINTDQKLGGYLATKHLLEQGHTKIGCITGPLNLRLSQQRLEGYMKALEEFQITYSPTLIVQGTFNVESGYLHTSSLLKQNVTAIFAFNDMMAFGVLKYLNQHKIKIPEELALIGFDDVWACQVCNPPLTTIHQPIGDAGALAVKEVLALKEDKNKNWSQMILTPTLVVRESTI